MAQVDTIRSMYNITNQQPLFDVDRKNETAYLWSYRLWELERQSNPQAAKANHLARMQALEQIVNGLAISTQLDKFAATFYRQQAENLPG
jgi:hypothetical protein